MTRPSKPDLHFHSEKALRNWLAQTTRGRAIVQELAEPVAKTLVKQWRDKAAAERETREKIIREAPTNVPEGPDLIGQPLTAEEAALFPTASPGFMASLNRMVSHLRPKAEVDADRAAFLEACRGRVRFTREDSER
jgi:hypothetical protein